LPRRTNIVTLEEPKLTAAASDPDTATPPALPLARADYLARAGVDPGSLTVANALLPLFRAKN